MAANTERMYFLKRTFGSPTQVVIETIPAKSLTEDIKAQMHKSIMQDIAALPEDVKLRVARSLISFG